jgi:hypothetical protein
MTSGISAPISYAIINVIETGLQQLLTGVEDTTTMWVDTDTWDDSEVWGEN